MQKQNHFTHLVLIVWVDLMTCSASVQTPPCMKCSIASGSMSAILPLIQCGSGNTGHTAQCPCTELEPTSLQWKPVHNKKGDSRSHSAPQCPAHQKQGEVKELKLSDRLKYRVMYALSTQLKISNIVRIWHIVSERSTRQKHKTCLHIQKGKTAQHKHSLQNIFSFCVVRAAVRVSSQPHTQVDSFPKAAVQNHPKAENPPWLVLTDFFMKF